MKKEKEKPVEYNIDFLEMAIDFLAVYYIKEIDINSMFQLSGKEKEKLKNINKIYSKIKLYKDSKLVRMSHLSTDNALELSNSILTSILPTKEEEIKYLDNLVIFSPTDDAYGTRLEYKLSKDEVILGNIIVPKRCSTYDVATLGHEKVHALAFNNLDLTSLISNGIELLPMILEKIILTEIADNRAIAYERRIRINDSKECFNSLETIKYFENLPDLRESDIITYNYFYLKSYDYLISDLLSSLLVSYYRLDKETMIKRLNNLFCGKISIEDFLKSYNANILNKDLIKAVKEETSNCKRMMILP